MNVLILRSRYLLTCCSYAKAVLEDPPHRDLQVQIAGNLSHQVHDKLVRRTICSPIKKRVDELWMTINLHNIMIATVNS